MVGNDKGLRKVGPAKSQSMTCVGPSKHNVFRPCKGESEQDFFLIDFHPPRSKIFSISFTWFLQKVVWETHWFINKGDASICVLYFCSFCQSPLKGRLQVMIWIWEQALYVGPLAGYVLDLGTGSPSFDRVVNFSIPYDDTHFKLGNFHSSDFFCAPLGPEAVMWWRLLLRFVLRFSA